MSKRYHYFYIIVNKVNRKFYYGVHSTNDLNDGYMGSGTVLDAAKKKYGIENFVKTILGFFDTREELLTVEREFVNPRFLEEHKDGCYNVALGGYGGNLIAGLSEEAYEEYLKKQSESHIGQPAWNKGKKGVQVAWNKGIPQTEEHKRKQSKAMKGKPAWNKGKKGVQVAWNKGKRIGPQSEEIKKKKSESMKGKHWRKDKETGKRVYY